MDEENKQEESKVETQEETPEKTEAKAKEPAQAETQTEETSSDSEPSEPSEPKPAPSGKFKELIGQIEKMSVLDLSELVKELEDRFGVSAAAPVGMMAAAGQAAGAASEEEEKDSFTVVIAEAGAQKIAVIKAVREIKPDLGLKEAKDLVEKGGAELLKDVKKEEAEEAKKKLEAAGAKVELR